MFSFDARDRDSERQEWERTWEADDQEDDLHEHNGGERTLWEAEVAAIWEAEARGLWTGPESGEDGQGSLTPIR